MVSSRRQALPDFDLDEHLALEPAQGKEAAEKSLRGAIASDTKQFWEAQQSGETDVAKKHNVYRKKSYAWLLRVSHMLMCICGSGVEAFIVEKEKLEKWHDWEKLPLLVMNVDQGSDGWTSVWFMAFHMQCAILPINDISHRIWNDMQGSLREAGLWSLSKLLTIACNFDHGPWQSARWLESCRSAACLYCEHTNHEEDPIFMELSHRIALDSGDAAMVNDTKWMKSAFESCGSAFRQKAIGWRLRDGLDLSTRCASCCQLGIASW